MTIELSSRLENGMISWERLFYEDNTKKEVAPLVKEDAFYNPKMPLPRLSGQLSRLLLKVYGGDTGMLMVGLSQTRYGDQLCELLWAGSDDPKTGHRLAKSDDIYELMERASRHYPGYMLGVPRANSHLVALRGLFDLKMWGFWLAALALAIQAINCVS